MSFMKAELLRLGFRFLAPNHPPSCTAGSLGPRTPTLPYPSPVNPPLSKSEAPRTSFVKTELPPLGFQFYPQIPPPSHAAGLRRPRTQTPPHSTPIYPPLSKSKCPCRSFAQTKPQRLGFSFLAQQFVLHIVYVYMLIEQNVDFHKNLCKWPQKSENEGGKLKKHSHKMRDIHPLLC
jgi:hypothetical protein